MKIRTGFVSNSSSSSFIILTSVENHEQVCHKLTQEELIIINAIMFEGGKLFGKDTMTTNIVCSDDYNTLSSETLGLENIDGDDIYKCWGRYKKLIEENPEEVFSQHIDY